MVDVEEQSGLKADPVEDFTRADTLDAVSDTPPASRRAALNAEREAVRKGQLRERIVVNPVESRAGSPVARPARAWRPSLRSSTPRRWGFHSVVVLALTAFFGTAALPAYATTAEGSIAGSARTALAVQSLTSGNSDAQVVARDGVGLIEAPEDLDSTLNTSVSPTVQALAVQLMGAVASGRLVGSTPNHLPEIADLAEGRAVQGCGIDYRVLQTISVALDNFNQVGVSDINRRCTGQIEGAGTESAHYAEGGGHAVDFFLLNGSAVTGGDSRSVALIRALDGLVPNGTGVGQVGCRSSMSLSNFKPFSDTCNHLHIDFLRSDAPALSY